MKTITHLEVAQRRLSEREILIITHEYPDGDALGCLTALGQMAKRLGVPFRMYVPGDGAFPPEYPFLPLRDKIVTGPSPRRPGYGVHDGLRYGRTP